jgi:hypothetical protein
MKPKQFTQMLFILVQAWQEAFDAPIFYSALNFLLYIKVSITKLLQELNVQQISFKNLVLLLLSEFT